MSLTGAFLGAIFDRKEEKQGAAKSAFVSALSKETGTVRRKETTEEKEKTIWRSRREKGNKGISIKHLDIHVDIKKIKDLEYLANLIDELKDAQMQEDLETT